VINEQLGDLIDHQTRRAVHSFDRMVEAELTDGQGSARHTLAVATYERDLLDLGMSMTEAVGRPGQPVDRTIQMIFNVRVKS
jgi:hypothetical protein